MKKMNKPTLEFIHKNIKTNAQSSSYPIRKQHDIKTTSTVVTPTTLNTANKHYLHR